MNIRKGDVVDYTKIGDNDIVKPKVLLIQVKDKDDNVIDTITSRTLDGYELKYSELYKVVEDIKEKFWEDLE